MNIMFIEISSASMFGSRQVFSGEIFVRLDSSAAFFSRWTGFRSPALTSCSFYFGRYRISVPEMVFFIFLWVGPNPPSGIGSLWVLVVLVLVRWWWWAMLMRLRKVLMMFSNRGWIAWRWFFFRCRWCVPFVMVIQQLSKCCWWQILNMWPSRCCDFWLWTKMMCRFTADDAWKKAHNLHLHPNLQGSPRKHRKTTFWGLWGEPSTITSRPTNHYPWKQRFLEPENWRLQVGPAPCKVCSTFVFILRLTQEAPEAPEELRRLDGRIWASDGQA